jgi:hypothetical protein
MMTTEERELYRRTIEDCRAVGEGMGKDDVLLLAVDGVAELLGSRLRRDVAEGHRPRSRRSGVARGHLHAVPTQEGA